MLLASSSTRLIAVMGGGQVCNMLYHYVRLCYLSEISVCIYIEGLGGASSCFIYLWCLLTAARYNLGKRKRAEAVGSFHCRKRSSSDGTS